MRHAATVAISTITESSLPAIVKSYMCQAVDDANHGHTSTANWIPVRCYVGRFGLPRMAAQVERIIEDIDLGAIARGGGA